MQGTVSRRTNTSGLDTVLLKDLVVSRAKHWLNLNIVVGKQSNLRHVNWRAVVDELPPGADEQPSSSVLAALESDEEEEECAPSWTPAPEETEECTPAVWSDDDALNEILENL
jgi:hypothetical protein